ELGGVFMLPAGKNIGPSFDRIFIGGIFVDRKNSAPAIIIERFHSRFVPGRLAHEPPFQGSGDNVVAILEYIGLDDNVFANDAFDWVATAIDQRLETFDDRGRKLARHQLTNRNS